MRDGLWLGGWADARPRVADSSLAEGRFKFFLGAMLLFAVIANNAFRNYAAKR